jgi:hypothetical protein
VFAEGDVGGSNEFSAVAGVQAVIAQGHPAFVLMVGDLTYGNATGQATVDAHFNDVMAWSLGAAYVPAGATTSGTTPATDDLRNLQRPIRSRQRPGLARRTPPSAARGEDWSWFDYGAVRFIAYPEP